MSQPHPSPEHKLERSDHTHHLSYGDNGQRREGLSHLTDPVASERVVLEVTRAREPCLSPAEALCRVTLTPCLSNIVELVLLV